MEKKLGNNTKKAICLQLVLGSLLILPINFSSIGEAAGVTINVPDQATYDSLGPEYRDANDNVVSATSFSGNTVTIGISGTTAGPTIYGGVYGGKSSDVANNNTVNFYGGTTYYTSSVNGGYALSTSGSATANGNTINLINYTPTIMSPFSLNNYASGTSSVTGNNNTITVENSDFGKLYVNGFIANMFSGDSVTASGNVINITKGSTVTTSNYGIGNLAKGSTSAEGEKNGIKISDSTVTDNGPGIVNFASGNTSTISDNSIIFINSTIISNGNGIKNEVSGVNAATLTNSVITGTNSTVTANGTGILNVANENNSTLTATLSNNKITFTDSTITANGTGIQNRAYGKATTLSENSIESTNSTVTANGGGLANYATGETLNINNNSINITKGTVTALGNGIVNYGSGTTTTSKGNAITASATTITANGIENFAYGVFSSLLQDNTITITDSTIESRIINEVATSTTGKAEANNNKIIIKNSTINQDGTSQDYRCITNLANGNTALATKNAISIESSTVKMNTYGLCNIAESGMGNVTTTDNTITVLNSTVESIAHNGIYNSAEGNYSNQNLTPLVTATGNAINISGSTVKPAGHGITNETKYGKDSILKNNVININSSTVTTSTVDSGCIGNVNEEVRDKGITDSNTITIDNSNVTTNGQGIINAAFGDNSLEVTNNTINILRSTVINQRLGIGNVANSNNKATANNNTVNIADSNITGDVYVGYAYGTELQANGNTLNISGTANNLAAAMLYGGYQYNRSTHLKTMGANNTLNMYSKDVTAADVGYFNNYNFYLPTGTQAGDTMLTVTKAGGTNLTGATVDIKGVADDFVLTTGDKVDLIKNTTGVTVDAAQPTTATALKDISTVYDFVLDHDANSLYATVKHIGASEQTKAFMESRLGVSMFVNNGANLIGDNEILGSLAPERKYAGITVMNYGKEKATTGSSVEAKGLSMLLGFGKAVENGKGTLRWAPFIEAGWGSYDAENEFLDSAAVHGNGNTDYYGLGLMARQTAKNGNYLEGSVRAGRVSDDYTSDLSYNGKDAEYDITTTYYGAHVGIGKVMEHDKYDLDVFAKYFYNKVKGDDVRIFSSDYSFDDTSSNRLKAGFKYTGKLSKNNNWFGGLAWEYEMSGSQEGTVNSYDIASPDYKGHSGIVTAGYTYTPDDKKYDANFSLSERFGKRHGISARVECKLKF